MYTLWILDPPNVQNETLITENENHSPNKTDSDNWVWFQPISK